MGLWSIRGASLQFSLEALRCKAAEVSPGFYSEAMFMAQGP